MFGVVQYPLPLALANGMGWLMKEVLRNVYGKCDSDFDSALIKS
jgi:hypothetical protein